MKLFAPQFRGCTRWYFFGVLVAVELVMSFSFLGYFHVEPISITIAYLPVLLAGALIGPLESTLLGAVFGMASMWKASASYVMAFDQLFSPAMSGHPMESFLLSIGSRALFGLAVGLLYCLARHARPQWLWMGIVSFFGPTIHSALVYSALMAFFPETGYTPLHSIRSLTTLNGLITALVSAGIVALGRFIMRTRTWRKFLERIEAPRNIYLGEHYHTLWTACIILVALLSSVAVAIYFVNRMDRVLEQKGISLNDVEHADLLHLQIQFLIGILSMMALVVLFLIFNRRYTTYMSREAGKDALTGVLNRKAFFQACGKMLRQMSFQEGVCGYFLMIDMDHFKEINDRYGHPEGDRALKEMVLELHAIFEQDGFIGRIGGDEFALLLYMPLTREELEEHLQRLLSRLRKITCGEGQNLSCSIGVQPIRGGKTGEELYQAADHLLYLAKQYGRGRYVIGPAEELENKERAG